jgi:hypothetical protein
MTRFRWLAAVGVTALLLAAAGCGDDDGSDVRVIDEGGSASGSGSASIETSGDAGAGNVAFAIDNAGEEPHEFVVVQGDSIEDLPTDDDGALDEGALDSGALIGEVEPFPGGESCEGTFELEAGDYVLLCNIVEEEDGEVESHLAEGMATTFSVGG